MAESVTKTSKYLPLMIRSAAMLFMESAKYLDAQWGLEGRNILRAATRNVGTWRGNQLRKAHMALNVPINMESLCKKWDSPSATKHLGPIWESQGEWSKDNVAVPVPFFESACESADLWTKDADERAYMLGHIYCDEFHIKFVQGYHPESVVVIPHCIMKGDPQCDFRFMLPPHSSTPPPLPLYENENPAEDWQGEGLVKEYGELRRKARITAGRIYYIYDSLKKSNLPEYKTVFSTIINNWSKRRAADEQLKNKNSKHENTIYALFSELGTPYEFIWKASFSENSNGEFEMNIPYCPYLETWKWLGYDDGLSCFCDNCYVPLIENYNNSYSAKLTKCMAKGDTICQVIANKR